MDSECTDSAVS